MSDAARREAAKEYADKHHKDQPCGPCDEHCSEVSHVAGSEWEASRPVSDEEVRQIAKVTEDAEWYAPNHCDYDHYLDACAKCREVTVRSILEAFVAARRRGE